MIAFGSTSVVAAVTSSLTLLPRSAIGGTLPPFPFYDRSPMHRVALLVLLAACRPSPPSPADGAVSANEPVALPPERTARPAHDAGPDGICEGSDLALFAAALDDRCAVTGAAWDALAAAPSPGALRQEAVAEAGRIAFRLRNVGETAVDVPVRIRPGRADLAAFSVLAEDGSGVYELAPPRPELPVEPTDGGLRPFGTRANPTRRTRDPRTLVALDAGTDEYVHSARIRLTPGGVATARLVVDPAVVKRLDLADAGPPAKLHGHAALHVGLLVVPFALGEPARVEIDLP